MADNLSKLIMVIFVILLFVGFSTISPIAGKEGKKTVFLDDDSLPDLIFIKLSSWWGSLNTTGIFVDFDVKNCGKTYYSYRPVLSILSFFADNDSNSFGYIVQKPFFYPHMWLKGEILGGCNFFEMDEKPDTITVKIDFTDYISESDETNNALTISVPLGVTIQGKVYKKEKDEIIPFEGIVELNQFDEDSLYDFRYRHYWSDANGHYNMSLCPKEPLDETHIYNIMARDTNENFKMIKNSQMIKSGENTTLTFLFEGLPPNKPNKPFGRRIGISNRNYTFSSRSTDPDGDKLFYKFKWGDGSYSDWLGPYYSGEIIRASHKWNGPGYYSIEVISKDSHDILSEWSDVKHILVNVNLLFFSLLDNIIDDFPFLQHRFSANVFNLKEYLQ